MRMLRSARFLTAASVGPALLLGAAFFMSPANDATAGPWRQWFHRHHDPDGPPLVEVGGEWHWVRSPDEEKVVVSSLFNRYCVRCHGIDGRGVWDIPGVPDFTNAHWQSTRTDAMFARRIIEGRGAVMPTFRGTLSLEESWAMARYLRTFIPGTEVSPPVLPPPKKLGDTDSSKKKDLLMPPAKKLDENDKVKDVLPPLLKKLDDLETPKK
jgi:hypothetical protein